MAAGATVTLYIDVVCTVPAAASSTAADFHAAGRAVPVADNAPPTGPAPASAPLVSQIAE
jgi:hypothetical protein